MSSLIYRYDARKSDGTRSKGTIRADSPSDASRRLRAEGLIPTSVKAARGGAAFFSFQRITQKDIVDLTQQLSVLVQSRIPLARGLLSIAEQEPKPALRDMLRTVAAGIEAGATIPEAFESYRSVLGDVYVETMAAAQRSGNLSEVLEHLSELLQKQAESRRQMRKALAYPTIVVGVVAIAVAVIVLFVVPRFGATFKSQGIEMPIVTRAIQSVGTHVLANWWAYAALLAGLIFGSAFVWRSSSGRLLYERAFITIPFVRRIVIAETTTRFARVLGLAMGSGLDMIEAIQMAGRATARPLFVTECNRFAERVRRGEDFADAIAESQYLPSFARRMMTAGEDSKEMSKACAVVSKQYDREVNHLTGQIGTLIEPLLTLALAGIVLLVALSVFLPMWQMMKVQ